MYYESWMVDEPYNLGVPGYRYAILFTGKEGENEAASGS
jgi:hypothetical protein